MSYQVLARKWRPQSFLEMVGQEHVLKALVNALDQDRLHHAYLFTGTRGVGKTTVARIFAKCLNCESGVTSKPCGTCGACREIAEGRFVDLIEIDAASRTKVEDMRELLENVQYAPTRGRFKVYLIDEVHMLSTSSFNALLKTLEEPPPHVKFLLATTDPQKLPVTVLSRCLQFNLKNMSPERIVGHLQRILAEENIAFEEPALWLLARAADGSMRDALSLTDQAIAFGGNQLLTRDVSAMLGTVDQGQVVRLVQALAQRDAGQLLDLVAQFSEFSPNYAHALDSMASLLHRVAIEQTVPGAVDNSQGDQEDLVLLARNLSAEDVQLFYQIAIQGRRDLGLAPDPRTGFEMTLLRMLAFMPNATQQPEPVALASSANQTAPSTPRATEDSPGEESRPGSQTPTPVASPGLDEGALSGTEPQAQTASEAPSTAAEVAAEPVPPLAEPQVPENQEAVNQAPKPEPVPETSPGESADAMGPTVTSGTAEPASAMERSSAPESAMAGEDSVAPEESMDFERDRAEADTGTTVEERESPPQEPDPQPASIREQAPAPSAFQDGPPIDAYEDEEFAPEAEADYAEFLMGQEVELAAEPVTEDSPLLEPEPDLEIEGGPVRPSEEGPLLANEPWVTFIDRLGLTGLTQNLAMQAVLQEVEGSHLVFVMDARHYDLLNQSHRQRVVQALESVLGQQLNVEFIVGEAQWESPARYRRRLQAERQAQAVAEIRSDPHVAALVQAFDAVVLEESIKPL